MRLTRIRLSGFKSFVDTTPVPLGPGITAIVGPNGCGKSNIIDAVRWVMGERSARHLRGASMADVIFSGSRTRQPVGQASIELVFDNADGSLGGQYARFSEIAVRRQVNRDGQSAYFLNGSRCRRRDITDIFLGTGLGPRSYAIIEQGTISRLIEARPEALRAYLEEAAGISLYKARRQETERRMEDTRGHLDRLEDMRGEVGRQLERLTEQARTAERYRALKAQARQRQAELTLLRIRRLEDQQRQLQAEIEAEHRALEDGIAAQRDCERSMTARRAEQTAASEHLNTVQARYYELGSEIAALEQRIRHDRETRDRSEQELEQTRQSIAENESALAADRDERDALDRTIATEKSARTEAEAALKTAEREVEAAVSALDKARDRRSAVAGAQDGAEQRVQLEQARIEQLEARMDEQDQRLQSIDDALAAYGPDDESAEDGFDTRIQSLERERERLGERLETLEADRDAVRATLSTLETERARQQAALTQQQGRLESLRTLQSASLDGEGPVRRWLTDNGLDQTDRLADRIAVTPGWEAPVEWALGPMLSAVADGAGQRMAHHTTPPDAGAVMLFHDAPGASPPRAVPPDSLAARVSGPAAALAPLARIRTADSAAEAVERLSRLAPGESVMTREGHWYGQGWAGFRAAADDPEASVVARARTIETLTAEVVTGKAALDDMAGRRARLDERMAETQAACQSARAQLQSVDQTLAATRARQQAARDQQAADQARQARLTREREALIAARGEAQSALQRARDDRDQARAETQAATQRRQPLDDAVSAAQQRLEQARAAAATARDQHQKAALRLERANTARASRDQAIERLEAQHRELQARAEQCRAAVQALSDPDETREEKRQTLLAERASAAHRLTEARHALETIDTALRTLDRERAEAERAVQARRDARETLRHRLAEVEARSGTQREQLEAMSVDVASVAQSLSPDATEAGQAAALERLTDAIEAMGPINLAAIDEQATLSERKAYLDRQHSDLTTALETLEAAIQRIDAETRTRFRDTFERVNAGLQRLFPTLFGGGEARLEMTEADLLETGVTLMARPPGKRITTIQLLSGGEKALAAMALVFAIFELNPAPFCMLDEVDAPLDDANVGRFCNLLHNLSDHIQFIVITHNKMTMEAAGHLAGVTMAEPGVSRLVAVDVESAVEMTTAT